MPISASIAKIGSISEMQDFDVVDHSILKFRLLSTIKDHKLWSITSKLLTESHSRVCINGVLGDEYPILQGVGQGRVLSPLQYKLYVDFNLQLLTGLNLSPGFGTIQAGAPTCADDVILLAPTAPIHQAQLDIMAHCADLSRYCIHPTKTKTITLNSTEPLELLLRESPVAQVEELVHLGIDRQTDTMVSTSTLEKRISSARATAYSLMGVGLHGINGLNPNAARSLILAYVLPRLLYGLETLVLTDKHLQRISQFFKKLIKQIQSLPDNTADPAPYLLLGLLPLEAYYAKNLVSLYASVLRDQLTSQVAARQLSLKDLRSHSWFIHLKKRLSKYQLTTPSECLVQGTNPDYWGKDAKETISSYWLDQLCLKAASYSTLKYLSPSSELPQRPLQVWRTGRNDALSTKHAIVKARLLTGTYRLQGNRSAFNQYANNPMCLLCKQADENRLHFVVQCQALQNTRTPYLEELLRHLGMNIIDDELLLLHHTRPGQPRP